MENEEVVAPVSPWLGEEPLETELVFSNDGVGEIHFGSIGDMEDWELMLPRTSDRVCSEYENHAFPMDEVFQREIIRWTKVSPSQIHPNSYTFMRAFELLCDYLRLPASKNVFFSFFTVQRGTDVVSFRQTQKMFEVFAGKVQSFKERFFLVRPRSAAALDNLLEAVKDGSLPRRTKIDKQGNPLMSADGNPVTEPCLVNAHELLTSENFKDCLENMKDLGALASTASKKISAKKRRKNVQSLEHLIAGFGVGSSSGPVVDLEGEDPLEELVQESAKKQKVGTPTKQPVTPIRAVPVCSEIGDFLQLPRVWSKPDQCGPHSTLFLDESELRIIHDLGPDGRSKAIADGFIATMKAL
ncbi:hypothetical protein MtrunA17_Chr6g0463961 [Medicago truncatula]|uniref:Uncharacterized protein n=1 Tax=Medicago truncatula TaxID=3880 RepID=A0A396HCH9_MEDTR|nr:hypothetical protein MtrunA17_Chr6g0463961 [Medicago truncatula]